MSSTPVEIVPHPVSKSVVRVQIELTTLTLRSSATFCVYSFADSGELFKTDTVAMEGEDYQKWTNNDSYAVDFCLAKLGYTRAPVAA